MADGDALPDNETWLRVLTNRSFVTDDGLLLEGALKQRNPKQRGPIAPPRTPRPWQHELSGRRYSLCANTFAADAQKFVDDLRAAYSAKTGHPPPSALMFSGIVHAPGSVLRGIVARKITADVIHTPIPSGDAAHADFVTYNSVDEDLDEVRTYLQERLKVSLPGALGDVGKAAQPVVGQLHSSAGQSDYPADHVPSKDTQ